jgi:hypothetical protein
LEISWVAFVGYFSLFCFNIQEKVLKCQYLNKKLLITREHSWHFNLNIFSHPTFALITDCNQIKQENVVDIHDFVDRYGISVSQMITIMFAEITIRSFFHSWLVTGFVTRVAWQMPHVEQELLTLTEHPGFKWGSCCLICIILCNGLQIIICPSVLLLLVFVLSVFLLLIFVLSVFLLLVFMLSVFLLLVFVLSVFLLLVFVLSVLLLLVFVLSVFRFTAYDYHFDIFKLFAYLE